MYLSIKGKILVSINTHETACLKGISLQDKDYLSLAKGIWEIVLLSNAKIKYNVYPVEKHRIRKTYVLSAKYKNDFLLINDYENIL